MKKILLIAVVALFGFTATAQEGFRLGANAGFVYGDNSDFFSFYANIDVDYDWEVSEKFAVGVASGVSVYSGKDMFSDFKYLPIAASADLNISDEVSAGVDVGYAISLEDGGGGDFMGRFQIRYQVSEKVDVTARSNNLFGDGSTLSSLSVGVGYRF